jgi:hypothetical protein
LVKHISSECLPRVAPKVLAAPASPLVAKGIMPYKLEKWETIVFLKITSMWQFI